MAKYVQICNQCGTKYYMADPADKKNVCDLCGNRSLRLITPFPIPDQGDAPGSRTAEAPGSRTADTPGSQTAEAPGSRTADTPGSQTADTPGSRTADAPAGKKLRYMQKCSECGAKYYMDSPSQRKTVCDACGRRAIRLAVPVLITEEDDPLEDSGKQRVVICVDYAPEKDPRDRGRDQVSSEGGSGWRQLLDAHQDGKLRGSEAAGTKDEKPETSQTGKKPARLYLKVSGSPGSLDLRLTDARGPAFIGRGWTRADYFEKDTRVSWIHCVLFRMADGKWYVRDMQSSNGTFLCQQAGAPQTPVSAQEPAALTKGNVIMLGPWNDAVRLEVTEV